MRIVILLPVIVLTIASPAAAQQYGYDAYCRPNPPPGFMMQPQPASQACLQQRAVAAHAAAIERQRQEAANQAAAAAAQARAEAEQQAREAREQREREQCEAATGQQVRETIEQDPVTLELFVKVLDVEAPHYDNGVCRADVMTVRGVVHTIVTFQIFNGSPYVRVRMVGRD